MLRSDPQEDHRVAKHSKQKGRGSSRPGSVAVVRSAKGLQLHFEQAKTPEKHFEADYGWVRRRGQTVVMIFDQADLVEPARTRIRIAVKMGADAFLTFMRSVEEAKIPETLASWASRHPLLAEEIRPEKMTEADQQATLRANLTFAGYFASDAELAFYLMPVLALSRATRDPQTTTLPVEGILTVTTSSAAFARLLEDSSKVVSELPSEEGPEEA